MSRVLNYFLKRKILTVFSGIIIFYLIYFGMIEGLSFKINGDFYTILSTISACKNHLSGSFNANFFPDALLYSPHTNLLSWIIAFLSNIFSFEVFKAFYIIAPACLLLFIFSFDFFLIKLGMNSLKRALVIITSFLLVPTVSNISYMGDSIFTLSDILVTTMGWRILGFALFFICAGIFIESEKKLSKKKIIALPILSFLLCNIYFVNFVILLALIAVYLLYQKLSGRPNKNTLIALSLIVLGGLVNLLFWPFYNIISLSIESYRNFQNSLMVKNPEDYDKNSLLYYLQTLSISLLALILLYKEKNDFIRVSATTCLLIVLFSLVIPYFNIPYFWRFAIFLKILLVVIFFRNFKFELKSLATTATIALILSLFFISNTKMLMAIRERQDNQGKLYQSLKSLNLTEGLILSDERTSNVIQAIDNYQVYNIPSGHVAGKEALKINNDRNKDLNNILRSHDYQKINDFLVKNDIFYIVLNQEAEFTETFKLLRNNDLSFYPKLSQEANLTVMKIISLK
jgi:hypothetical protein